MQTDTVRIETIDELWRMAARLLAETEHATSVRLMELNNRGASKRWRELAAWEAGATADDVAAVAAPYLPSASPLALWARQGRRKLRELRFDFGPAPEVELEPAAPVDVSGQAEVVFEGAEEVQPLPTANDELGQAVAMYRDQLAQLRQDLAAERLLVRELVSEALTTGRGSQASLVKLIGLQGNLLADAWKAQANTVNREVRRLESLQAETEAAEDTAAAALEAAAEAQEQAEQGGQLIAALMQQLGPDVLSSLMKGGAK